MLAARKVALVCLVTLTCTVFLIDTGRCANEPEPEGLRAARLTLLESTSPSELTRVLWGMREGSQQSDVSLVLSYLARTDHPEKIHTFSLLRLTLQILEEQGGASVTDTTALIVRGEFAAMEEWQFGVLEIRTLAAKVLYLHGDSTEKTVAIDFLLTALSESPPADEQTCEQTIQLLRALGDLGDPRGAETAEKLLATDLPTGDRFTQCHVRVRVCAAVTLYKTGEHREKGLAGDFLNRLQTKGKQRSEVLDHMLMSAFCELASEEERFYDAMLQFTRFDNAYVHVTYACWREADYRSDQKTIDAFLAAIERDPEGVGWRQIYDIFAGMGTREATKHISLDRMGKEFGRGSWCVPDKLSESHPHLFEYLRNLPSETRATWLADYPAVACLYEEKPYVHPE